MPEHRHRYPGAQPFADDDFARKVFFGREAASRVLADKIQANRIVVVYARSGLGKTSLLQAGVAPRLRDEGYLPLFVRVNDVQRGPFSSVLETIPREAERQLVEYVPGLSDSLWSFFKTAELWRGDLLLTPVLILDQFEELFTLQSEQARAHFLNQLSYLTRGVRPPSLAPSNEDLSEDPPALRIVLSLREDYLGFLEEAAEHIPQILDARFRLSPLDLGAAREAIVRPAAVSDPDFETRPFALDDNAVASILDYLSQRRTRTVGETRRYVEPFQLQLICGRIEQIAAARQRASESDLTITMADIGGKTALTQTLRDFYQRAIGSVPDHHGRRASRRLCEEYLISPEGRRLSLEENEIRRQLDLPKEALSQLVESRLLRSENRSESTYYELSHDALVEPILATRRIKAQVMGAFGIGSGAVLFILSSIAILVVLYYLLTEHVFATATSDFAGEVIGFFLIILGAFGIIVSSVILLRGSARSILRYRRAHEPTMAGAGTRQGSGYMSGLSALFGGLIVVFFGLLLLSFVALIVVGSFADSALPVAEQLEVTLYVLQARANGIGLDTIVYLVALVAVIMVGGRLCRWGVYRLAGYRGRRVHKTESVVYSKRSLLHGAAKIVFAGIALAAAAALVGFSLVTLHCDLAPGRFPEWLPSAWFDMLVVDCEAGYPDGIFSELVVNVLLISALLFVALPALRRGFTAIRHTPPRPSPPPVIARSDADAPSLGSRHRSIGPASDGRALPQVR